MNTILNISLITIKELLHEKVFYLLGAFALLAISMSLLLGDLTYAQQSKITFDFLLAGIQLTNLLFSVFMGITLLHRELNLGWIAMVLSKPVSRLHFLLGKFIGQILVQASVILMLGLLTVLICENNDISLVYPALIQTLLLIFCEGVIMSAVVYLCAVNLGALMAAATSLFVFALGNLSDGAIKTSSSMGWVRTLLNGIAPNLRMFNTKALASYGLLLEWELFGILVAYTFVCATIYFCLAGITFSRRDIFT